MQQQQSKSLIKRKPLNFRAINSKINKRRKVNNFLSPSEQHFNQEDKKYIPEKQAEKNIGQNISLIAKKQEGSFISNKQDQSLDSFDKMIMGVDQQLDFEDQNTFNSKENQVNYTNLYQQFQRLIKNPKISINESCQMQQQNNILRQNFFPQDQKAKESSFQIHNNSVSNINVLKQKLEQIKDIRKQKVINQSNASDQNISLRLLGANLSEIHEQEIQHNTSINRMDPIQQEFIDFVSKNNQTSKINISKIEKNNPKEEKKNKFNKNQLNSSIKEPPQEDQVVVMLKNLGSQRQNLIQQQSLIDEQSQTSKKKDKKQFFQKQNYHQILRQLDQNQDKKTDNSHLSTVLSKRQEWINNRTDRSSKWKIKQLQLLYKIKQIFFNPYIQFSEDQKNQEPNLSI